VSIRAVSIAPLALILCGCAAQYNYTLTAEQPGDPKPASCNFRVTGTLPEGNYEELGVLDFGGGQAACNIAAFKESITPKVCEAGGDLVVGQVNGFNCYIRGLVLRKAAGPSKSEPSDASPSDAKPADAKPAEAEPAKE
jgi:hypothetical protein